jgi:glycerophosphoryl diester phosphodiesterase
MRFFAVITLSLLAAAELWAAAPCPLVLAHRGASGYRPEHTLVAYQLAMDMGADFVEPDLVITRDGELIARHEPNIMETTDVLLHPEFADRRRTKMLDGKAVDGFFAEDFTLAEIKRLRAVQNRPYRDQSYNGVYPIPTLREIITLVQNHEKSTGRKVGLYPEIKHPSYFRRQGLPLEEKLIDTLILTGFVNPLRLFIQSFEVASLKDILRPLMRTHGLKLPLIQLVDALSSQPYDYVLAGRKETYGELVQKTSLKTSVATYARGIGVWKGSFVKREPLAVAVDLDGNGVAETTEGLTGEVLPLIADAHAAGLLVHTYTMRNEEQFLALGYASARDEYKALIALGVDGFFTDFPDTAREAISLACPDRLP